MDDLRSWWEVPSIAHFCSLFRNAFDLTDFDIEDLEEGLIESGSDGGSDFIRDLLCKLLNGCYSRQDISAANYDLYVKDVIKYKWEGVDSPIHEKTTFKELTLREKVELIHAICEYRLDAEDVTELLKGFEGDNMRVEPLGKDKDGGTYWYFYGNRLYKEDAPPKTELTKEEKRAKEKARREENLKKKREEKLKKKKEKQKQKALKKLSKKKALKEKLVKEDKSENIRRSGRIKLRQLEQAEKDSSSDTSSSSSSSSSSDSESEESTEEEEEEEVSEPEQVEVKKKGKKNVVANKTPVKKSQPTKGLSKSTGKKQPQKSKRGTVTPKQQKIREVTTAQSDPNIRRSSRLRGKKETRPPPPKFDSDSEEEDNDDNDSGNESAFSDDDKSVKSEVSKYSNTSSVTKTQSRPRKMPISKIDLNKKFSEAGDCDDEDKTDNTDDQCNDEDNIVQEDLEKESSKKGCKTKNKQSKGKTTLTAADSKDSRLPDTDSDGTITEENGKEPMLIATDAPEQIQEDKNTKSSDKGERVEAVEPENEHQDTPGEDKTNSHMDKQANDAVGCEVKEEICDVQNDAEPEDKSEQNSEIMNLLDNLKDSIVSNEGGEDCKTESVNNIDNEQIKEIDASTCNSANDQIAETKSDFENDDIKQVKVEPKDLEENHEESDMKSKDSKREDIDEIKNMQCDDMKSEGINGIDESDKMNVDKKSDIKDEKSKDVINDDKSEPNEIEKINEVKTEESKGCSKDRKVKTKEDNDEEEKNNSDDDKKDLKNDKSIEKDIKADNLKPALPKASKPAVPPKVSNTPTRWHLVCSCLDDWVNLAEWFKESTVRCEKSLSKIISEDFLPVLPEIIEAREKERRKRLQELEVRRSDRITHKQREKMEQEKILAEALAEEEKAKLQAEEERKLKEEQQRLEDENRMREERMRAREERANRLSMREERARLIAEGREIPPELIYTGTQKYKDEEDSDDSRCDLKDESDYQNLTKMINALKIHKDCWPFLEPVTDEQAPGYSEIIKRPMDISKIELKVEKRDYRSTSHFLSDFKLMFNNCKRFNGPDSEFTECARSMEKMLKKYTKKFLTDEPADHYYDDKDFHVTNIKGNGGERRYRPKRAASSRALQTVKKALHTDDEESSDEEELEPLRKRPREFPAKTISHQSLMLQEMIEMKRQREKRLAASALQNHQVITRGPERVQIPNPAGGVMIIPKEDLPPSGVLRLAATREIKRKVDPQSFIQRIPGSDGQRKDSSLSVIDSRRHGAKPPKTIRIVAASPTASGTGAVKETAESVKVSSDGYLIIGGKNSGIKVSENTKIVIQPPSSQVGLPGQNTTTVAAFPSKEIVIKKLPATSTPQPSQDTTILSKATPGPSMSAAQQVLPPQKQQGIITAASSPTVNRPGNTDTQTVHQQLINKVLASSGILAQNQNTAASPEFQKKQVDIAQRIIMLNQQKRKLMQQNQQQPLQGSMDSTKMMKLDPSAAPSPNQAQESGHQTIEDRLRQPAIDNPLGAVTKDVVSSVNIASDILDSYYSVMNKPNADEASNSNLPHTLIPSNPSNPSLGVSENVTTNLRNKLLSNLQTDNSTVGSVNTGLAQQKVNVIANGPNHVTSNTVTSHTTNRAANVSASFPSNSFNSTTLISRPNNQLTVGNTVNSAVVSSVNVGNICLNPNLANVSADRPVSIQTVVNSTRNLAGGKVQINLPGVVPNPITSLPVALTNITLPPQPTASPTYAPVSVMAPMPAPATFSSTVSHQQSIDSTVSPIEALFSSDAGAQPVSIPANPLYNTTLHGSCGPISASPPKNDRPSLFDMFENNKASVATNNSNESGLINIAPSVTLVTGPGTHIVQSAVSIQGQPQQLSSTTSTVNYGSPLKTMSIMEALKSKLNPAKVNQPQESASAVSQSNVPKTASSVLTHCTVDLAQAHLDSHANTSVVASIACCSSIDQPNKKQKLNLHNHLDLDNQHHWHSDSKTETNKRIKYKTDEKAAGMKIESYNTADTSISLVHKSDKYVGVEEGTETVSGVRGLKLMISDDQSRVVQAMNSSVGTQYRHSGINRIESEIKIPQASEIERTQAFVEIKQYHQKQLKEKSDVSLINKVDKNELWGGVVLEGEQFIKDDGSVYTVKFKDSHAIERLEELKKLKKLTCMNAAEGDGNKDKNDKVFFRVSDTGQRCPVNEHKGLRRGSNNYKQASCMSSASCPNVASSSRREYSPKQSQSLPYMCNETVSGELESSCAGYFMENDTIKYVVLNSNDGDLIVKRKTRDGLKTVNLDQVDNIVDEEDTELEHHFNPGLVPCPQRATINNPGTDTYMIRENTYLDQISQTKLLHTESTLRPNNAEIYLNELARMRLSQKIKKLSGGESVYKLKLTDTNQTSLDNHTQQLSTSQGFSHYPLRGSLSDGCLGRSKYGTGPRHCTYTSVDHVNTAINTSILHVNTSENFNTSPQTYSDTVDNSFNSSLTCDEAFFTSELISNPILANTGEGDNVDYELEKIQDDILELQDKYMAHRFPQTTGIIGQGTSLNINSNTNPNSLVQSQSVQNWSNSGGQVSVNATELIRTQPIEEHGIQLVNVPGGYANEVASFNLQSLIQQSQITETEQYSREPMGSDNR